MPEYGEEWSILFAISGGCEGFGKGDPLAPIVLLAEVWIGPTFLSMENIQV
jgi:hypothetical protein